MDAHPAQPFFALPPAVDAPPTGAGQPFFAVPIAPPRPVVLLLDMSPVPRPLSSLVLDHRKIPRIRFKSERAPSAAPRAQSVRIQTPGAAARAHSIRLPTPIPDTTMSRATTPASDLRSSPFSDVQSLHDVSPVPGSFTDSNTALIKRPKGVQDNIKKITTIAEPLREEILTHIAVLAPSFLDATLAYGGQDPARYAEFRQQVSRISSYNKLRARFRHRPGRSASSGNRATPCSRQRRNLIYSKAIEFTLQALSFSTSSASARRVQIATRSRDTQPQSNRFACVEFNMGHSHFQSHIHDILVNLKHGRFRSRFRIFLKRHIRLPANAVFDVKGDIIVMRVASENSNSLVHLRSSDAPLIRFIMRKCVPSLLFFASITNHSLYPLSCTLRLYTLDRPRVLSLHKLCAAILGFSSLTVFIIVNYLRQRDATPSRSDDTAPQPSEKRVAVAGPSRTVVDNANEMSKYYQDLYHKEKQSRIAAENKAAAALQKAHAAKDIARETARIETEQYVGEYEKSCQLHYGSQVSQLEGQIEALHRQTQLLQDQLSQEQQRVVCLRFVRILAFNPLLQSSDNASMTAQLQQAQQDKETQLTEKSNDALVLISRLRSQRSYAPGSSQAPFPDGPPHLRVDFMSQETRKQHASERLIHKASNRIPIIPLQPPLPGPSSGPNDNEPDSDSATERYKHTKGVVEDILEEMGFKSAIKKKKGGKAKRGNALYRQDILAQQATLTREEDLDYKKGLRVLFHGLTSTVVSEDFKNYVPAPADLVLQFNNGEGGSFPSSTQLDFGTGFMSSLWNVKIIAVWRKTFQDKRTAENWPVPVVSDGYVQGLLFGILKDCHEAWARWQPRWLKLEGRPETAAEVRARMAAYLAKRKGQTNNRTKKQRKLDKRKDIVVEVLKLKILHSAPDLEFWKLLERILKYLDVEGMSSDEDGIEQYGGRIQPIYKVKFCVWRAATISDYMRIVDDTGPTIADNRGNAAFPRVRCPELLSTTPAPKDRPLTGARHPAASDPHPSRLNSSMNQRIPRKNQPVTLASDNSSNQSVSLATSCLMPNVLQVDGYVSGSVRCNNEIYMVFAGDPEFVRSVLVYGREPPPVRVDTVSTDFRSQFVDPNAAYTMFIPRYNVFQGPLLGRLGYEYHTLPVICYGEGEGWGLHSDTIDEWRTLELNMCAVAGAMNRRCRSERPRIIPYPAPYRFGFEKKRYTEATARRVARKSIEGFLPLIGQLSLFFFLFARSEDLRGSNWRSDVISEAKVHPAWFDELERAVTDWTIPRMGGVVDLRAPKTPHSEHTPRTQMDFLLGSIITSEIPLPLYIRFGEISADPRECRSRNPLPLTLEALPFFPDNEEIQYLKQIPGVIAFSEWEVTNDLCVNYPGDDKVKTFRKEMSAFFARRQAANEARLKTENGKQKASRLQKEAHAAKGDVPGNKGAKVFVWELVDGHRIRQAAGRRNYADYWEEYSPSQRIYDSFRDEWDLCETFGESPEPESGYDDDYDEDDGLPPLLPDIGGEDFVRVGTHTSEADLARIHGTAQPPNESCATPGSSSSSGYEVLPAETQASLRFGYATGVAMPSFSGVQLPSTSTVAKALGNKDITLPQTSTLERLKLFFAQCKDASSLKMITADLIEPSETGLLCSAMEVTAFSHQGSPHYCIRESDQAGSRCIVVSSAITILEIIRNWWDSDLESLSHQLLSRGVAFKFCILNPSLPLCPVKRPAPHYDYRSKGYKPDQHDYAAYINARDRFLASSRGALALRYGGVVARIARSVLSLEDGAFHPTDEAVDCGVCYHDGRRGETYWDGELTPDEIDLICGVYHIATGQRDINAPRNRQTTIISWWPRPVNFLKSGINVGWWSPACENFYQRRLAQIAKGDASLPSQIDWKNNMRFDNKVPLYMDGFEKCAQMMLKEGGLD
ncbi:hypothetical protein R3P38DRAFT_2572887 [Favolaschia claudopus]|uniref:Uncharacterized protein n=1 Tax=Favolaschia claudopus TaxID=2862362 RepID=A0AAV9ZR64_9AGAR